MSEREWNGEPLWLYQLWWRGGQDPNKMTARKIWDLPLLYSLLDVMCSVCRRGGCVQYSTPVLEERGDRQMRQKARVLTLIGVLTNSAGPECLILAMMGTGKGNPCCLTWKELVSWEHLAIPAAGIQHIVIWEWHWSKPTLWPLASLVKQTT